MLLLLRNYLTRLGKRIDNFPKSPAVVNISCAAIGLCGYMVYQDVRLERAVYKKMEMGSKPLLKLGYSKKLIARKDMEDKILRRVFPYSALSSSGHAEEDDESLFGMFGLIVGPTGTGKSTLITHLCNRYPEGVLYHHVGESTQCFAIQWAQNMGMKVKPNILDKFLAYFSSSFCTYYNLPEDQGKAAAVVISVLTKAAIKFTRSSGKVPTLFMDNSDLLAKTEPQLFLQLVRAAKYLADRQILTIVFVSSEGSVLPIVKKSSEISRCRIMEVLDVDDNAAIRFLMDSGISEALSIRLVGYFGGRLIHLVNSVAVCKRDHDMEDDMLYNNIIDSFFALKCGEQMSVVRMSPSRIEILSRIKKYGATNPAGLVGDIEDVTQHIRVLVDANVIRFTSEGLIDWHGKVQKTIFSSILN